MINLLGKRYYFFLLSMLVILPGLVIIIFQGGLPLSIDFKGGSMIELQFKSGDAPSPAEVVKALGGMGITDTQVTTTGNDILIIKAPFLSDDQRTSVVGSLETQFNDKITIRKFDNVGPSIGQEVTGRAGLAVALAALGVVAFITFAFRKVENAFRYGLCAIIAMLHDVLVVISVASIGGLLFGWQVDSMFLVAFLTVIGFSVQDKIVVFDRVRENSAIFRRLPFERLVNHSIIQTLQRSINTQLMTSEFMLLAMALFGGVTMREFAVILLVGLFSGTYSSIFIAAPILVVWENKEWRTWFKRGQTNAA